MKKISLISLFLFSFGHFFAQVIYLSSTNNRIYRLDILSCDYEEVVRVSHSLTDISFHPNGTLYGISGNGNLFEIDTISGLITGVYDFNGQSFNSLTTSGDGTIYATGDNGALWSYNVMNDQAVFYGLIGFRATGDLTFYKGKLYVAVDNDRIVLIDINNPPNSKVVIDDNISGEIFGIVSYSESCDSINCYAISSGDSEIYLIDFVNNTLQLACNLNIRIGGGASTYEFLGSAPSSINDLIVSEPACNQDNGSITVVVDGIGPFLYSKDGINFQSQNLFDHLVGGNYTLVVSDANGCTISEDVSLINTDGPDIDTITTIRTTCEQANGEIEVLVNGGNGTILYSIDGINFQSSPVFPNLNSGTYLISVRDTAGCTTTDNVELNATSPGQIESISITSPVCNEIKGSLMVKTEGGSIIQYSIDGNNFQSTGRFDQLDPGNYILTIQDENGCKDTLTASIEAAVPLVIGQIESLDASCGGNEGSIHISALGGTGQIQFSLDGIQFQTDSLFENLAPSGYVITIQDDLGCRDSTTALIDPGAPVIIQQIESVSPRCDISDGSLVISSGGGTGQIQYSINGTAYQSSNEFFHLGVGTYTVDILDDAGCRATASVEITESPPIIPMSVTTQMPDCGEQNGSIALQASGGTGQLKMSLNGGAFQTGNIFQNISAGENTITITDENGCIADTSVFIKQKRCQIYIPNTFSPNQDGVNDYFMLSTYNEYNVLITKYMIFDRWGNLVYSAYDFPITSTDYWWDGTFKRISMSPGAFAYYIEVKYEDDETQIFKGDVTLVK